MDMNGMKWKEYKVILKEKLFDETLTDEQMKQRFQNKLNDAGWNHLIMFWRSLECHVSNSSYESLFFITCP